MAGQHPNHHRTKRVALGGILIAFSIIILLLSGFTPIATFTGPIFASLCLIPLVCEFGSRTALLAYFSISLLAIFLVPDKEVVLLFALFTGFYPILQPKLAHISFKPLRILVKLLLFIILVITIYSILLNVFGSPGLTENLNGRTFWFWGVMALGGSLTFLLYDILVDKVRIIYLCRFRHFFLR